MSDLETRLRHGLNADVDPPDVDLLLHGVRRGAAWRRGRRASAAAALLVAAVVVGSVAMQSGRDDRSTPQPATQRPSPSSTTSAAANGRPLVVGLAAAGSRVFRLTSDLSCVACSSVWQRTASGQWQHLFDFEGRAAYGGKIHPRFGPVELLTMAPDGRDGWAWGRRLWATHDAGRTWSIVDSGPGTTTAYGYSVAVGTHEAWAVRRDAGGLTLWRSVTGSDTWQRITDMPRHADATDLVGVLADDRVVVQVSGEGGSDNALVYGTAGDWSTATIPFGAEHDLHLAGNTVWDSIPEPQQQFRLSRWVAPDPGGGAHPWTDAGRFGGRGWVTLPSGEALVLTSPALLVGADGRSTTDLRLGGARVYDQPTSGADGDSWLLTSRGAIYSSGDGLHWTLQP